MSGYLRSGPLEVQAEHQRDVLARLRRLERRGGYDQIVDQVPSAATVFQLGGILASVTDPPLP